MTHTGRAGDPAIADAPGERSRLRSLLGETASVWAGHAGSTVREGRWSAISGVRSVDYNLVVCHSGEHGTVSEGLDELISAGVPGVLMLAGEALGQAQTLIAAGWVCIGSAPFMELALRPPGSPAARPESGGSPSRGETGAAFRCRSEQLPEVRAVIQEAFSLEREHALVALPPDLAERPGDAVWAVRGPDGQVVSCLISARRDDVVGVWSMATVERARRSGYGAAVLDAALVDAAELGARRCLLYASEIGEGLYRSVGFRERERWQMWSRPRWVLGRA